MVICILSTSTRPRSCYNSTSESCFISALHLWRLCCQQRPPHFWLWWPIVLGLTQSGNVPWRPAFIRVDARLTGLQHWGSGCVFHNDMKWPIYYCTMCRRFVCPAGRKDRQRIACDKNNAHHNYEHWCTRAMFSCSRLNVKFVLYIFNMFIIGVFEERLWRNNLCT